MQRTRYYRKKAIGAASVRGLRDVLSSSFNWGFAQTSYCLCWPSEDISVKKVDEIDEIVQENGQPTDVRVTFKSSGGQMLTLDTRGPERRMRVDLDKIQGSHTKLLEAIETSLDLEVAAEPSSDRKLSSAFVAHAFDDQGQAYANELARFLALLGIRSHSGRGSQQRAFQRR